MRIVTNSIPSLVWILALVGSLAGVFVTASGVSGFSYPSFGGAVNGTLVFMGSAGINQNAINLHGICPPASNTAGSVW